MTEIKNSLVDAMNRTACREGVAKKKGRRRKSQNMSLFFWMEADCFRGEPFHACPLEREGRGRK